MAAAVVFVLCFFMACSSPLQAAEKGEVNHVDTRDYCLRAGNVTVNMTELAGLDQGQKQALVENVSAYAIYKWKIAFRKWGEPVSASGDFGAVNWEQAGSYPVTVRMPALSDGTVSEVTYTLTIIDDLPQPPAPAMYRVRVCFLDEETGLSLREDYISEEMEEGTPFEIDGDLLLPPEGYTVTEILGDLEGAMVSDREILVICRKEEEPQDPPAPAVFRITVRYLDEETEEPVREDYVSDEIEEGSAFEIDEEILLPPDGYTLAEIRGDLEGDIVSDREILVICRKEEEDPETGSTDTPGEPGGQEEGGQENDPENSSGTGNNSGSSSGSSSGSGNTSHSGSGSHSGKNTGKTSGKNTIKKSGSTSGSAALSGGRTAAAAPSVAPQSAVQSQASPEERQIPQIVSPAETAPAAEEAAVPSEAEEEAPAPSPERAETAVAALTEREGDGGQSELGGAVLPQAEAQKEGYPLWSMAFATGEGGILAVLGYMIFSDVKLILWFEKKKRR